MIHLFLPRVLALYPKRTTKYVTPVKESKWHCTHTCVLIGVISMFPLPSSALLSALPAFSVVVVQTVLWAIQYVWVPGLVPSVPQKI